MLGSWRQATGRFVQAVLADHRQVARYRQKYHQQKLSGWRLPLDLVQKVGFQQAVAIRIMQLLRDLRVPLGPQVASRLIRHLYGSDVHWDAQLRPGLSLIHGIGLIIGHGAKTEAGCILFQNVTLGEGIDPQSRQVGAPSLAQDVHVGPGCTLLGPIEVGAGSKLMAGSVLTVSVPPLSLVTPAKSQVRRRGSAPSKEHP